jgi:hypothetical protein
MVLLNGYRSYFSEIKRPRREVNDSPPSSAEVKYEWSHTSDPSVRLYGADREDIYTLIHAADHALSTNIFCGEKNTKNFPSMSADETNY